MVVVEVCLVEIFSDEVVEWRYHAAVRKRGRPSRFDVENVVSARACNMLRNWLRILVGM